MTPAAWRPGGGGGRWYRDHSEELDSLFDRLVQVRDKMGKALGFGGYTGLGYCRMQRSCYGEEEVARFLGGGAEISGPRGGGDLPHPGQTAGEGIPHELC